MPSEAVDKLIEEAIRDRIVLRVTYRPAGGGWKRRALVVEPLAIRFNLAQHRVLWCWSREADNIEELLWDGIEDATTTGEKFAPRPWSEPDPQG